MSDSPLTGREIVRMIIKTTVLGVATYYSMKYLIQAMDPTGKERKESQKKASKLIKRLGINDTEELSDYEMQIAAQLVDPSSIETSWEDIAGMDDLIDEIKATVILPLKSPELFKSDLHQAPKGVLFHGPPGCGKTMLAKATAKAADARFINLEIPALTDKWYGESQKLAQAVFTLAIKIQPCIIFIDEIDSLLRARSSQDHEATAMMKAQFMMLWDGIASTRRCRVVVMGATNRPSDVDPAILRRMPAMFQIGMPKMDKRASILKLILKEEQIDDLNIDRIAQLTEHFSGSDLNELCRTAAMVRIRSLQGPDMEERMKHLRPIKMEDFEVSVKKMRMASHQMMTLTDERLD